LIPPKIIGSILVWSASLFLSACVDEAGNDTETGSSVSEEMAADETRQHPPTESERPLSRMDMPEIAISNTTYRQQVDWDTPREGFQEPGDVFDSELSQREEGPPPPTVAVTMASDGNSATVQYLEEGIWDDAIGALELRAEMELRDDDLWYVSRIGWRLQCWRGPTPGEWVTELCP
jgi:hypothetical protein